jgi:hypothetical protein
MKVILMILSCLFLFSCAHDKLIAVFDRDENMSIVCGNVSSSSESVLKEARDVCGVDITNEIKLLKSQRTQDNICYLFRCRPQ